MVYKVYCTCWLICSQYVAPPKMYDEICDVTKGLYSSLFSSQDVRGKIMHNLKLSPVPFSISVLNNHDAQWGTFLWSAVESVKGQLRVSFAEFAVFPTQLNES